MRDPQRIPIILKQIGDVWKKFPDWRFGQLMSNFEIWYGRDIFWPEDEEFVELLEEFVTAMKIGDYNGYKKNPENCR